MSRSGCCFSSWPDSFFVFFLLFLIAEANSRVQTFCCKYAIAGKPYPVFYHLLADTIICKRLLSDKNVVFWDDGSHPTPVPRMRQVPQRQARQEVLRRLLPQQL